MSPAPHCSPAGLDAQSISDLFHGLSQPLTTLRCSLELAMMKQCRSGADRAQLEAALADVEQITILTGRLRAIIEAFIECRPDP